MELLLVLAALLALLAAFLPLIQQTRAAADYAAVAKQEQLVLAQAAADCREAKLGGAGTRFSRDWFLPVETSFSFDSSSLALKASFEAASAPRSVVERVGFPLDVGAVVLPRGSARVVVENSGGVVRASFQALSFKR